MLGIQFDSVGSDGILLKDISGSFEDEDTIQIAYTDENGLIQFDEYFYFTEEYGIGDAGWYNGDYELVGDTMKISKGSAMWFIPASGEAKDATTAGEIKKGFVERTFDSPNNMICASYPVAFNPNSSDVIWSGLTDEDTIQVAYTDENGLIQFNEYFFFSTEYGVGEEDAWYDGDYAPVEEPIAVVGQGFWLLIQNEGVTLKEISPVK